MERHRTDEPALEPAPRVVLVPGVGMWTVGPNPRAAALARDIYLHTMGIMAGAESLGGYRSLPEPDGFRAEYWPLELYKLTLAPPERDLAGRVALVTGATGALGREVALRLAAAGAQVVVTDLASPAAEALAGEIAAREGAGSALALALDVTREDARWRRRWSAPRLEYGGVDVVVSNAGIAHCAPIESLELADWERSLAVNATGHFLLARAALRLLRRQGTGGSLVFVATKNVTAPGKDFAAYSASKAAEAQLARVAAIEGGPLGVRVNMVNPDAIFAGSGLWAGIGPRARPRPRHRAGGAGRLLPRPHPAERGGPRRGRRRGGALPRLRALVPDDGGDAAGGRRGAGGVPEVGNREQGTGNREQGTGNREQGTGNREQPATAVRSTQYAKAPPPGDPGGGAVA